MTPHNHQNQNHLRHRHHNCLLKYALAVVVTRGSEGAVAFLPKVRCNSEISSSNINSGISTSSSATSGSSSSSALDRILDVHNDEHTVAEELLSIYCPGIRFEDITDERCDFFHF